jgi:[ribosomal protein S5]-alanine N-acetyltransferase
MEVTIEESKVFLQRVRQQYITNGYSFWAVIRKTDHRFIGICGLLKQIIDNTQEIEVGYRLDDAYWGNGYGPEAAMGCINYARGVLHTPSVISLILEVNKQSIRVAEKNGMVFEKVSVFHGQLHRVYRKRFS